MTTKELEKKANEIRQEVIRMFVAAGSGHAAGSLGMADVFTALYFKILTHDPKRPTWKKRDRLILSNGHICPVRYAAMAHSGYFPISELKTLRELGSRLQGHPERTRYSGFETTSGPLGCGLAQAAGIAYAARMDGARFRTFCITSDGEHDSGNHWEAVMFAGKNKLSNLTCFVDRNFIQSDGDTEDVMPLEPLKEKYEAFNWHVIDIDGHNMEEIINAVTKARMESEEPTVIIANITPGKGVSFMEDLPEWHGKVPNKEEAGKALEELKVAAKEIRKKKEDD
ncbi:transketolase [Patescibacteria group bacterium]|nr:transketolase [Patescibacteria group bacterium]MBU0777399.1 transketolase [Patescibacteria group bacterium]MBU0846035.1 transketolase [Patescibacteria group bacterium]MBU0922465.1 transketolase [Patescibacteria group bacterium]MBU1066802.1 transketolase [Patescibacteria group bacterium]